LHGFVRNKNGIISYYYKICKKMQGGNPTPFYNNEGANNIGTFIDTINGEKVFGKQVELNNPQIDSPIFEVLNALLLEYFINKEKKYNSSSFPNTMRFVEIQTDVDVDPPIFFYTHVQGKTIRVNEKSKFGKFTRFIRNLRSFGNMYGFSHNDLHMSNVMYSNETNEFTMIDYGSCHFHLKTHEKIDIDTDTKHLHKYLIQDPRFKDIQFNESIKKYYNVIVLELSKYKSFFMKDFNTFKFKKPIEFDISSLCMGIYENFYDISELEKKKLFPIKIHRGNYIPQLKIYNKWVEVDENLLTNKVELKSNEMFQTEKILQVIESGVNFLIEYLRFKNYKSTDSLLKHGIYANWTYFDQDEKNKFLLNYNQYKTMSGGFRSFFYETLNPNEYKTLNPNEYKKITKEKNDLSSSKQVSRQSMPKKSDSDSDSNDEILFMEAMTKQKFQKTPAFLYNTTQEERNTWTELNINVKMNESKEK